MLSAMVGKRVRWQMVSASRPWSAAAGPAGRRLAASFGVGLARSFAQRASAGRKRVADRAVAALLRDSVSVVALESAAPGDFGGGVDVEGTGERASQRRCLVQGHEVTSDAGAGLASRTR